MPSNAPHTRGWRRLRLHRATVAMLALTVTATLVGTSFAAHLVSQSDTRLLRQQTAEAALVLASLLNQTTEATGAVAATLEPDGQVNELAFARTADTVRTVQGTEGFGIAGVAIINVATHRFVAKNGTVLIDPTSAAARAHLAASTTAPLTVYGITRVGTSRVLGLVAPATDGDVVYLELPLSTARTTVPDLPGDAFAGVAFALYFGAPITSDLVMTSSRTLPLHGTQQTAAVGADLAAAWDSGPTIGPQLLLVLHPTKSLSGRAASLFPGMTLTFGLIASVVVMLLLETTQRRRDQALALVGQLEERNTAVEHAVARQASAEERLRQAQRLEVVGQLAGGVAHDFNNLLAVIVSYAGFLRTEAAGQPWADDVEEIDKAARRAAELTQQLLLFGRRDAVPTGTIDMRSLLADRQRLLQRTLSDDIHVAVTLPDHVMPVRADLVELDQVVMNLAVNARDAMPDGGTLHIHADDTIGPDGTAAIRLRVTDTGTGMSPDVQDHAFEPFFTTKEVGRGTGLGLATVYGIVGRWGGTVSLQSAVGQGTTVTVLLPRADEPATPLATPDDTVCADRVTGKTVLLVEDEASVRAASSRILREAGFTVIEACSGPDALDRYGDQHVDVLVSDVVMPGGVSGPELADRLRLLDPHLPVVLASGYGRDHLDRRGSFADNTELLRKPFAADTLVAAVHRCLDGTQVPA